MNKLLLVLVSLSLFLALGAAPVKSMVLEAAQDAYVVTDAASQEDPQGLRDQNFGGLDFLRLWYRAAPPPPKPEGASAETPQPPGVRVVSLGLLQFDLQQLKDLDVESASLQLFAQRADMAQPVRLLDVSLVSAPWRQEEVTFNKRPQWGTDPIAIAAVYSANRWYAWDVTDSVARGVAQGSVSYVMGLRTVEQQGEEQVVFASRETGSKGPRLVVTYAEPPTAIAWWVWAAAIAGAAALAFGGGLWLARRGRVAREARHE